MTTLQFKCTLLTDVVLNIKSATEGNQSTLDFIPGNCFLGIVATCYDELKEAAMELFHSGKVRFGDAHPACGEMRTLRIPASMYYPKLVGKSKLYIHHLYKRELDKDGTDGMPQQLKQCREGFYAFSDADHKGHEVKVEKSFSLKSGYDRELRRSKDSLMYGYEALEKGGVYYFEVEVDDDEKAAVVCSKLIGEKHIGRSRSAQYGLVKIESVPFIQTKGSPQGENGLITVYADGRLIFLDENGRPTFRPTPQQLGIEDEEAKIDWGKSQVRTFQYAPWNGKRQSYDTDRCGVEKGSVFVVRTSKETTVSSGWVGHYLNEGFGRVIYNPSFLKAKTGSNGLAVYHLQEQEDKPDTVENVANSSALFRFLKNKQEEVEAQSYIYAQVNKFVDTNRNSFRGANFASQWGTIRSIAMKYPNTARLRLELFDKKRIQVRSRDKEQYTSEEKDAYLTHGVAAEKWKANRIKMLSDFIVLFENYKDGKYTQQAVINLAAEMAKICI